MTTPAPIKLLGLCGSLRKASNSLATIKTLAESLPAPVQMTLFPLHDIPPYNGDQDGELCPAEVRKLKQAIADCQGLVVCSPEYNYGISGVLKNALDWASRPSMASPLKGKPALIMTTSPSFAGGVRAQVQIRETLTACLSRPLNRAQVVINHANEKVKDGRLVDQASIDFMLAAVDDLVAEIRLVEGK
ncbi:MAG TPA: NAD(P)H-dependent oxidoreductase [Pusillimonas sp.]|uniref:NADPH-dependent FMN reductase n=1 Tax=Pusillimonas sp. TaxID=3040095 RepID=UPI002BB8B54B|nr:NAD(P)H-dependent oxidoreductase [Pusillimonas sp.]HUH87482.1 NAD(P)H-dependent oxidoreductase [Pusillimonas sp.]